MRISRLALAGLAVTAAARSAAAAPETPDLSGVWWSTAKIVSLHPQDGSVVPFTTKGLAEYQKDKELIKTRESKLPVLGNMDRCLPSGVPRVYGTGFPFQIMQAPNMTIIAYEKDHMRRFVYLNQTGDLDPDPAFMGNSVGHWEGDTFVVESNGYKAKTFLDDTGLPHGEQLKLTERYRKIGDGKTLEIVTTINDAEMYGKPWTIRETFDYRPDVHLQEYICAIGGVQTRFGTDGKLVMPQLHAN